MFATLAAFLPQAASYRERLDIVLLPPLPLVSGGVIFGMVDRTQRNRELVAHLECQPLRLSETDVMRVRWRPPTDETRLLSDITADALLIDVA